jgi:hypothetical protein
MYIIVHPTLVHTTPVYNADPTLARFPGFLVDSMPAPLTDSFPHDSTLVYVPSPSYCPPILSRKPTSPPVPSRKSTRTSKPLRYLVDFHCNMVTYDPYAHSLSFGQAQSVFKSGTLCNLLRKQLGWRDLLWKMR